MTHGDCQSGTCSRTQEDPIDWLCSCTEPCWGFRHVHSFKASPYLTPTLQQLRKHWLFLMQSNSHCFKHTFLWKLDIDFYSSKDITIMTGSLLCIALRLRFSGSSRLKWYWAMTSLNASGWWMGQWIRIGLGVNCMISTANC